MKKFEVHVWCDECYRNDYDRYPPSPQHVEYLRLYKTDSESEEIAICEFCYMENNLNNKGIQWNALPKITMEQLTLEDIGAGIEWFTNEKT